MDEQDVRVEVGAIQPLCKVSVLVFLKYRISREFLFPMWLFGENTKGFVCHNFTNYQGATVIKKTNKKTVLKMFLKLQHLWKIEQLFVVVKRSLLTGFLATTSGLLTTAMRQMMVMAELSTQEQKRFLCRVILWQLRLLQRQRGRDATADFIFRSHCQETMAQSGSEIILFSSVQGNQERF